MQHFLKDWWKFIQIHQYYTTALIGFWEKQPIRLLLKFNKMHCYSPKHSKKPESMSVIFWNSNFTVFLPCKRSLQSRRYYSGFWSRGTWPSAEWPRPATYAHYTCTVKGREKSRMRNQTFIIYNQGMGFLCIHKHAYDYIMTDEIKLSLYCPDYTCI